MHRNSGIMKIVLYLLYTSYVGSSDIRTPLFLYQFKNIRIQGRNDRMKLTKISENRMDKNARR
jgi:hypothetical protein